MAGVAGEGLAFEEVKGGVADLVDLQRILSRSRVGLKNEEQQSMSRWAVKEAAALLKREAKSYEALMEAMKQGKGVIDCVQAIEANRT